ncbi:TIGR00153 family protein [Deltaproteobacteria bacterium TL4]
MINLNSIFGKSPFVPLREHMKQSLETVKPLKAFFEALFNNNDAELKRLRNQVFEAEEAADKIKNALRSRLPRSLFMPIDRKDLLEILEEQDNIADTAQDIVSLLELRRMTLPESMRDDLYRYLQEVEDTCVIALNISTGVGNLMESGFGNIEIEKITDMIEKLSVSETKTDDSGIALTRKLFEYEDQLKPVDVIFWYQIFEMIGDLADHAEKMGNRLRLTIARS